VLRLPFLLSWLLLICPRIALAASSYSPSDFGAVLDGTTNDGPALQRAIDTAHAAGGGTVHLPAGKRMLTGSFELKSHVTLHLEPGSRLLGSTEKADYRNAVLIEAFHAEDIAITGTGTIDGQGIKFMAEELPHIFIPKPWRPKVIIFEGCRRVKLQDFTIRDSPNWTIHLAGCDDVVVHGVRKRRPPMSGRHREAFRRHRRATFSSRCVYHASRRCIASRIRSSVPAAQKAWSIS
jgi:polygalacturonase